MALPKLNEAPKYSITIPSTNKKVRFRPFLVKEEKVLLLAMESEDQDHILQAILDTITACVVDELDTRQLTTYDIEYLFTKIRAKSVGETTKVGLACEACETTNEIIIPVDDIGIKRNEDIKSIIELAPGMELELRHPSYLELFEDELVKSGETAAATFAMIRMCLKSLRTEDSIIELQKEDPKELDEFLESMNTTQFESIREWIENIPAMAHDIEFTCSCGHANKMELKGIQSFF